jgi:hypothetical protein
MLVVPLGGRSTVAGGPVVRYTRTDLDDDRLIGVTTPYGAGHFGQAGARAELLLDGRDRARAASRGAALNLAGSLFPSIWDVRATYGEMHGDAMTYLTPPSPLRPTLALRAGGRKVWGDYPFSDAATLGDDATVRLGRKQRYAGDAEVHLNAELRVKLFRAVLVLPADIGVFGLRETGRVFLAGESSDTWHNAVGGGVFLAFLQPQNTLSLAIARSAERTGVYVGGGFAW